MGDTSGGGAGLARFGRWAGPLGFLFLLLAPWLGLDLGLEPAARACAAVVAWTALWWLTDAVPIGAASLLPAALMPLTGVLGARRVAEAYMNDLILLFLGAFLLALLLERWNLHRRLALAIAVRAGGHPRRLVLGFMLAASLLSMWLNNTATALMLLPIAVAVVAAVERDAPPTHPSAFSAAMLLGLAYSCSVGGMLTPVGTAPNQVLLGLLKERLPERPEIGFGLWMVATLPILLVFLPLVWWVLTRFALKVSGGGLEGAEVLRVERNKLGPIGTAEWRAGLVFGAAVLLWVFRSDLNLGLVHVPGWERLLPGYELSNTTVALSLALLCFLLPSGTPGVPLLDWHTAQRLPFDVLLLLGGGFALAEGIAASGLDRSFASVIAPLLDGLPGWLAVLLLIAGVSTLTELTSNTATVQVLLPVLMSSAIAVGRDPLTWMLPATLAASCAFMLPVGTPPNAVVFTSGRIQVSTMARVGLWVHCLMILAMTLIFELWIAPLMKLR